MKLVSWNVNGIRAVLKKDFLASIKKLKADIVCLQETKAKENQVDEKFKDYEYQYWNSADKAGYAGTLILSKIKPIKITLDIGIEEHDTEGRIITLEFDKFHLVNGYIPNSGRGIPRLAYRKQWDKDLLQYIKTLEKTKPVIFCGDLNVAHTDIDLANPKSNYNKTAGYTQIEIDGLENYLKHGLVDTFRRFNKEPGNYTWWSYMFSARQKNIGWRIDYFLVSKSFEKHVRKAEIHADIMGSDHCPVSIEIDVKE